ncbi:hypothetical protein CsSME_00040701 [Camellia sinensis var. sinensis]
MLVLILCRLSFEEVSIWEIKLRVLLSTTFVKPLDMPPKPRPLLPALENSFV